MSYLLNLVYLCVLLIASPWLLFCAIWQGKYREGFAQKFLGLAPQRQGDRPCIWLHAVSVGEANLLQTIVPQIERRFPNVECVISVTTRTAFDMATEKYSSHTVFYCPLDFTWAVDRAMKQVRPDMLVLVELELWPNLLGAAKRHHASTAIVNGRLSEKSFRGYSRIRRFIQPLLESIDLIAVQNQAYADRFLQLGARADTVHVTGSIKFDGASTNRENSKSAELTTLAGIQPGDIVFLAGSTQDPEEQFAFDTFQQLRGRYPQLKLILVPRHPHRFDEVAKLLDQSGVDWRRRTDLRSTGCQPVGKNSDSQAGCATRILLVDTIGELGAWWATAHIGFVGGSMGSRGGQNMIEPAAYGVATSFGPNTKNFRDVVDLMRKRAAAVIVSNGDELTTFVERCLSDPEYIAAFGQNAQRLVQDQVGATNRTLDLFDPLILSAIQRHDGHKNAA